MDHYPTLALIDRALGARSPRFAASPDAAFLEHRARELADEYWSDTVWLTGRIPEATFRIICAALERDRLAANAPTTPTSHRAEANDVVITRLNPSAWQDYKSLRLEALATDPQAFEASYDSQRARPDAYWRGCLQDATDGSGSWLLFAKQNHRLVGMVGAAVTEEPHVANINSVFVTEQARGRGAGRTLIDGILEELGHDRSVRAVRLYVNAAQRAAVRLYERLGFQVLGEERSTYGDGNAYDEYLMERIEAHPPACIVPLPSQTAST